MVRGPVSDVMLPVSPFSETSGTFVNTEGRAQSFVAVAKPQGETRPAWKVLRVLGNLLGHAGFDYTDSESVRRAVIADGEDVGARLDNTLNGVSLSAVAPVDGLERVADVPLYAGDAIVRRAAALQRTVDAKAPTARMAPATLAQLGLQCGDPVQVKTADVQIALTAESDETLAAGCVRIAAAHESTVALGTPSAVVTVERA